MKIGIVGLGLIGGSIFKDLKNLKYDVIAVSQSQQGENIYKDYNKLSGCDLVFVCSAISNTPAILDKLEEYLTPDTVVTDVCSVKSFVCNKKRPYIFVPSHPMAGTEKKGYANSKQNLFVGATWVITPVYGESKILEDVITSLGAKIVKTTPQKHDQAVALISHMPMIVSQALFKTAQDNELALQLASSGFRDMTRLAMSNTQMAQDMYMTNNLNIQNSISSLIDSIKDLMDNDYYQQIQKISVERSKMFK